jgi:hypothetical protein
VIVRDYPLPARLYIEVVLLAAAIAVALSVLSVTAWGPTALLLALMVVLERTRFDLVAQGDVAASVGTVMTLPVATAAYIIDGPAAATLVGASALAVAGRTGWVKRVFNAAQFALAAGVAGLVYVWLGGPTHALTNSDFPGVLLPILAANLAYCVINAVLLAGVLWFAQGAPPLIVLRGTILQSAPSYLGYGLFGLMIAVLWVGVGIGPLSAVLVMLPLFVARWAIAQYALERSAYEATIRTLVRAVETKDHYTRGHSERVSHASVMIAKVLGMGDDRLHALRYAGILHDVGKLGVPTKILQKTGRLTDAEFQAIALHPVRGREMVEGIEFLGEAFEGILHHHERLDGRGYPMGLTGEEIPEFARVIAVADAFDSMTSTRSYRGARTVQEAVDELIANRGTQFDPRMVDAMIAALEREPWQHRPAEQLTPEDGEFLPVAVDHDDPAFQPVVLGERRSPRPPR